MSSALAEPTLYDHRLLRKSHDLGVRQAELLLFVRPHIIPPNDASKDAKASINQLTDKEQVKHYLDEPSKDKKENLLKQLTQ